MFSRSGARAFLALPLLGFIPGLAFAQGLSISHDGLGCWPTDQYPVVTAMFSPLSELRNARVYFRSESYPDFYHVDARPRADGVFEAVLPVAAPDTERVIYYIEAVTLTFESARTREWAPPVAGSEECRRKDPVLALFTGDVPNIVVGAVRAGAPLLPPGFQVAGIVAATSGGGLGAATLGAIVAGGAAGGAVVATAGDDSSSVTTSVEARPSTTTIAAGTTTTTPATTTVRTTTSSSTTTTTAPETPPTTTTSTPASTTGPPNADLSISLEAPASIRVGSFLHYQVVVENHGPSRATNIRVDISLPLSVSYRGSTGDCSELLGAVRCRLRPMANGEKTTFEITVLTREAGTVTATATVSTNPADPNPGNDTATATTMVTILQKEPSSEPVRMIVHLDLPPRNGGDRGEIVADSRLASIDDTAPLELRLRSAAGEYSVEAMLVASSGATGRFRFELHPPAGVEVSGIAADTGEVLALEPREVIFVVRGEVGERLRFRYRLSAR